MRSAAVEKELQSIEAQKNEARDKAIELYSEMKSKIEFDRRNGHVNKQFTYTALYLAIKDYERCGFKETEKTVEEILKELRKEDEEE